ncbi:J domain-containing protein [Geomonas paludis]|uniref:J domain-containing protein n=1 Tax=Geomonas paludis TaxID=2740185 RepID=A0A6V8MV57_9BACT|nr:J domain-containing protein [Geomonas paludis]UPU37372.1 J domain-containing protein [Geomonas paludis]GFO64066.1 molecular chaperone DnaJ [Geomonas paludis]
MTYKELQLALAVFGLEERASLREIKNRHRELVKRHHPDLGAPADSDEMRKVNAAYRVLLDYLADYRFSFAEEEFYEQNPDEQLRRQFFDDPLWGGKG